MPLKKITTLKIIFILSWIVLMFSLLKNGAQEKAFLSYSEAPQIEQQRTVPFNVKSKIVYVTNEEAQANAFYHRMMIVALVVAFLSGGLFLKLKESK